MTFPFHPILLATYVWLSAYATNHDELFFDTVLVAGALATAAAAVLLLLIWVGVRRRAHAGVISTLLIVCLVYYGHAFDAIDTLMRGSLWNKIFMPIWVGSFLIPIILVLLKRSPFENLTKILNASAIVLVLIPLSTLITAATMEDRPKTSVAMPSIFAQATFSTPASSTIRFPDIYYLIFDRYADNRTLNSIYNYDNNEILNYLRGLGFYVADRSRANYAKTAHSLASSLNLTHLTYLSERIGSGSGDWKPLYAMLQDYEVARFLRRRGYRYVHLGSWWEPTRHNRLATENFEAFKTLHGIDVSLNEFEWLLVEPLLLTRIANLVSGPQYDRNPRQFVRVQRKFKKLAALQGHGAPLFVFAHFLVPHDPFVFFPDGRYKTRAEADSLTRNENYIDQLIYVNKKIKELVDELLSREPRPIIVIQADEGPIPMRLVADSENFDDWRKATVAELRQKFRILNALYFPDNVYDDLYANITPVNTFRIIFNRFFDENLQLLPDVSYSHYSGADLYSFFDVTEAAN